MPDTRDYYEVLDVKRDFSEDQIKQAYRKLALKFHPDRNQGDKEAEQKFKEISQAYDVLSDGEKRRKYDQFGHDGLKGYAPRDFGSFENIFEAFGDVFGGGDSFFSDIFGVGGRGRRRSRQGTSLRVEVQIDLAEAASGCTKELEVWRDELCGNCGGSGAREGSKPEACETCGGRGAVMRSTGFFSVQQTCPRCAGQGKWIRNPCRSCRGKGTQQKKAKLKVTIPAGIEDSTRLRMTGQGEPSREGGSPGDLFCDVFVKAHSFFERHGSDVVCQIPIPFKMAVMGGEIEVPTLDGRGTLKIPKGTQSGQLLRIRSAGIRRLNGRGRGDQIVSVVVEVPKKTTRRQEELLEEFDEIEDGKKGRKTIWDKIFGER